MQTPDVTKTQMGAVGIVAIAIGAGLNDTQFIGVCVLAAVSVIADAVIRFGRAKVMEAKAFTTSLDDTGTEDEYYG